MLKIKGRVGGGSGEGGRSHAAILAPATGPGRALPRHHKFNLSYKLIF